MLLDHWYSLHVRSTPHNVHACIRACIHTYWVHDQTPTYITTDHRARLCLTNSGSWGTSIGWFLIRVTILQIRFTLFSTCWSWLRLFRFIFQLPPTSHSRTTSTWSTYTGYLANVLNGYIKGFNHENHNLWYIFTNRYCYWKYYLQYILVHFHC